MDENKGFSTVTNLEKKEDQEEIKPVVSFSVWENGLNAEPTSCAFVVFKGLLLSRPKVLF